MKTSGLALRLEIWGALGELLSRGAKSMSEMKGCLGEMGFSGKGGPLGRMTGFVDS